MVKWVVLLFLPPAKLNLNPVPNRRTSRLQLFRPMVTLKANFCARALSPSFSLEDFGASSSAAAASSSVRLRTPRGKEGPSAIQLLQCCCCFRRVKCRGLEKKKSTTTTTSAVPSFCSSEVPSGCRWVRDREYESSLKINAESNIYDDDDRTGLRK